MRWSTFMNFIKYWEFLECLKLFQTNDAEKNETEHLMPHTFLWLILTVFKIINQETKCIWIVGYAYISQLVLIFAVCISSWNFAQNHYFAGTINAQNYRWDLNMTWVVLLLGYFWWHSFNYSGYTMLNKMGR
jgi:hypothetical protein